MTQIALVTDEHDHNVGVGMVAEFLEPAADVLVGLMLGNIVDEQGTDGTTVVRRGNGTVTLLSSYGRWSSSKVWLKKCCCRGCCYFVVVFVCNRQKKKRRCVSSGPNKAKTRLGRTTRWEHMLSQKRIEHRKRKEKKKGKQN